MKKITKQYRQGDVLLHPVAALPAEAQPVKAATRIVLAEGEQTGHAHAIQPKRGQVKQWLAGTELYLEVRQPVTLEHEEHALATVEPGIYHVRRQVEVWMDEVRQVSD